MSNRDVDALIQMQYEDALADEEPWALDSFQVRQWMALDGKLVTVWFEGGEMSATGIWEWKNHFNEAMDGDGTDGQGWWLVYINHPTEGYCLVGTAASNFTKITVLAGADSIEQQGER